MAQQSIWTDEVINILKNLIEDRYSAAVIADELTTKLKMKFTRNMISGKINRLKMGKRKTPVVAHKSGVPRKSPVPAPRPMHVLYDVPDFIEKTPSRMLHIDQLDSASIRNLCRFPDRNEHGETIYCGLPTGGQGSWCAYHRQIAIQPVRVRI